MKIKNFVDLAFSPDSKIPFTSFLYGGKYVHLSMSDFTLQNGIYSAIVDELTLSLELDLHEGDGAAVWMLRFTNSSDENSKQISSIRAFDAEFERADGTVFSTLNGDDHNEKSFLPRYEAIDDGCKLHLEPYQGRSASITAFPYFDISDGDSALVCAVGWTGQWFLDINGSNSSFTVDAGLADADLYLKPQESIRTVRMCVMCCDCGAEDARRRFRRFTIENYSPLNKDEQLLPVALQNFDRYFWTVPEWRCEPMQLDHVEKIGKTGVADTYWLDAAWFKNGFPLGVGNFCFDPGFEKNGLKKISEAIHKYGMKFLVWFEPERIYETSDTWRDHRDFLLSCEEQITEGVTVDVKNFLFNLGNEDARKWLADTIISFMRENGIDTYRQDFNMDPLPYWRHADEPNRRGLTEIKFVDGLYKLWDSLREAIPNLLIDNCSSGGRRIDFETCMRSVPLWRSDTGCGMEYPDRPLYSWDQNQTLSLTRYVAFHSTSTWAPDAYSIRSAGTNGLAFNICMEDEKAVADMAKGLQEFIMLRPYFNGDMYAHSEPNLDRDSIMSWQYDIGNKGILYVFAREYCEEKSYTAKFAVIDAEKLYSLCIHHEDLSVKTLLISGKELLNGLSLDISPRYSYAIEYEALS